ncbi:MAG: hypothetical protein AB8G11_01855 [Saprospiraceae bacterium]
MLKRDKILQSFLEHEIIKEKYSISKDDLPKKVFDAQKSKKAIIKTIALIVNDKESSLSSDDKQLYRMITQYLNEAAI